MSGTPTTMWAKKTAPLNSLADISAKRWPKSVKFGTPLATRFLNICAKNYTDNWFKSKATGISVMCTDVTHSKRCHSFRRHIVNWQESHRHHRTNVNSAY